MMTLTQDVKKEAEKAGFVAVGVSNLDMLRELPYGKIKYVGVLKTPEEVLPEVKSVVLMGIHAWDPVFNVVADSSRLHFNKKHRPSVSLEGYQLYYQIASSKAWKVAQFLMKKGYDSSPSFSIPLKTSAVRCGLCCQGKNTLLVTPTYGSRVRLVSLLTTARLDVDEPFKEDLCKNCDRCIRACPGKAIEPYKLNVDKCMVYASENPRSRKVPDETRQLEKRLVKRPTPNSLIECSTCLEACPIGKTLG
jgi:epoxyqueuosine reductase QueG